jgi:hypothetical protein
VLAAWLAILSRGPGCERWRSFAQLYSGVGPRPSWRHLLMRDDPTGAFEPGNADRRLGQRIDGGDRVLPTIEITIFDISAGQRHGL